METSTCNSDASRLKSNCVFLVTFSKYAPSLVVITCDMNVVVGDEDVVVANKNVFDFLLIFGAVGETEITFEPLPVITLNCTGKLVIC